MDHGKQRRADLMLVLVTLCWGVSYYLMDLSLADMDPFTLNSYRFLIAFVIAALFAWKTGKLKNISKATLIYGFFAGFTLMFVYIGATFGVKYTTLSNSGFLCALTVIFTPIFGWIFLKQKPDKKLTLVVIMCTIGIAFLTLKEDFSINMANLKGDLLCISCGVAYAVNLLITEKAVEREDVDAFQLGVFQLGVTGALNLIMALITEVPHLPGSGTVWGSVLFLAVFCTGVAFIVQPIALQYTTASHSGVIFTLEPVFSGIVAAIFAHEILSARSYFGAFLMMASILIMEVDFKSLLGKGGSGSSETDIK